VKKEMTSTVRNLPENRASLLKLALQDGRLVEIPKAVIDKRKLSVRDEVKYMADRESIDWESVRKIEAGGGGGGSGGGKRRRARC